MTDYGRIERAITYIRAHRTEQPGLAEVASHVGLSPFYFQRLFQRWAGISPKRFLQFLTLEDAKRLLADDRSVLDASLAVGLSGPSRLHDLFLSIERLTPGEYKSRAEGLTVSWGVAETPFGAALFAALDRGLCGLAFIGEGDEASAAGELAARWPRATLAHRPQVARRYAGLLRSRLLGAEDGPLALVVKGTSLQLRVWEALLRVPEGRLTTYGDLAEAVGAPSATRAVASAVARNPVACLIPCHRVIRSSGAFGEYRWGSARKLAILAMENARRAPAAVHA